MYGYTPKAASRRAQDLLDAFGLGSAAGRQVKKYSGGMRRRIDIAASIVVTPELLFLDEPTTGLDPRSRNEVWDIIRAMVDYGTTVMLTTQYLDEADQAGGPHLRHRRGQDHRRGHGDGTQGLGGLGHAPRTRHGPCRPRRRSPDPAAGTRR
ncbi:ATP-binding cassette domain-containing protein [Demequina litorisediminis]|uniref:ATP-binding cassette domain-containing protein n=1 Tax=Demequina litorisediminis TaxID=1849022 RepID=UPI0032AF4165